MVAGTSSPSTSSEDRHRTGDDSGVGLAGTGRAASGLGNLRPAVHERPAQLATRRRGRLAARGDVRSLSPLPLGEAKGRTAAWRQRLRLADWFSSPEATVHGVPFRFDANLATTPVLAKADLRFACDAAAQEVFVLLLAKRVGRRRRAAYGGGSFQSIRDVDRSAFGWSMPTARPTSACR